MSFLPLCKSGLGCWTSEARPSGMPGTHWKVIVLILFPGLWNPVMKYSSWWTILRGEERRQSGWAHTGNQLDLCQNRKKLKSPTFSPNPFYGFSTSTISGEDGLRTRPLKNRLGGDVVGMGFICIHNKGWFPAHIFPQLGQAVTPSSKQPSSGPFQSERPVKGSNEVINAWQAAGTVNGAIIC